MVLLLHLMIMSPMVAINRLIVVMKNLQKYRPECLTCFTERPASAEGRVDGHWMDETRDKIADCQVDDEDVGWRPQSLEPEKRQQIRVSASLGNLQKRNECVFRLRSATDP